MIYHVASRRPSQPGCTYMGRVAGDTLDEALAMLTLLWPRLQQHPHTSITPRAKGAQELRWDSGYKVRLTPAK